ncbi:hypothetical protein M0P48_03335 [Candidatus Gracilibacteria bacterium]|nr:hypothetical protein [Candidatus Gracilibacteria bacterium]
MCFSAEASFITSGVTAIAGVAAISQVKNKNELPLAITPLLFSLQQLVEGLQWISDKPSIASLVLGYIFLFFAFTIWPTYIPFAVYKAEKDENRKATMKYLLALGFLVSTALIMFLIISPLSISTCSQSIKYDVDIIYPTWRIIPYVIATCGSCLLSSHKYLKILGVATLIALFASWSFYSNTFGSVWCFFCAALSAIIYMHFHDKN